MRIEVEQAIDAGHRIVGHQGKCRFLHGHTYHFLVSLEADVLNELGMVADFSAVKEIIKRWDHKMLLWEKDPIRPHLTDEWWREEGVLWVPFNPTAERMAAHLGEILVVAFPQCHSISIHVSETPGTRAYAGF